jgi:hypothetical protein
MASTNIFIGPSQSATRRGVDLPISLFVLSKITGEATVTVTTTIIDGITIAPTMDVVEDVSDYITASIRKAGVYSITLTIENEDGDLEVSDPVVLTITQMEAVVTSEACNEAYEQDEWVLPEPGKVNPSPFLGDLEKNMHKQITDEVVERMTNQLVFYYAIDAQNTTFHPMYGEAINKKFFPPVRLPCLVEWKTQEIKNEKFTIDKVPVIVVQLLKRRIEEDLQLNILAGDFVQWGRDFFEIVAVESPTHLYGANNSQVDLVLTCVKARQGTFYVESQEKLKI